MIYNNFSKASRKSNQKNHSTSGDLEKLEVSIQSTDK